MFFIFICRNHGKTVRKLPSGFSIFRQSARVAHTAGMRRGYAGEAEEIPPGCKGQVYKLRDSPLTTTVPHLDTWLEDSSTSSDLISEVSSIKDSENMEPDFNNNSDNVVVSSVEEVEVSVHQELTVITSAILVLEQALTSGVSSYPEGRYAANYINKQGGTHSHTLLSLE